MNGSIDTFVAPLCHAQIEILYQDESILLIDKPSGLLSLSGKNPLNLDSVHFRLRQGLPDVCMVHRLDFGTSGLMLLALNKSVNANLTKQFQQRSVLKTYEAVLSGHLVADEGCIDAPISRDKANFPLLKICHESGKQALSKYRVIKRSDEPISTRVLFTPKTGRTHQLRIHSQEIGHPILGCDHYGSEYTRALAPRLLLHALSLEFDHPVSGERMKWKTICPF